MLKLEDFGITLRRVTALVWAGAACAIITAAVAILIYCLFGIGLARIAKKRGDKKSFYAYLPFLRYIAFGKLAPGSEKNKKTFSLLLPVLCAAQFVILTVTYAMLTVAAAGLVFAAENKPGSAIALSALYKFPVAYCIAAVIICVTVMLATKAAFVICYYGAFTAAMGKTAKATLFTVLAALCCPLGEVLLFIASREKKENAVLAEDTAADAETQADKE